MTDQFQGIIHKSVQERGYAEAPPGFSCKISIIYSATWIRLYNTNITGTMEDY